MRSSLRKLSQGGEDEDKKVRRSKMKTRPPAANATASPFGSRRVDAGKRWTVAGRTNKSVGPTTAFGKPPVATPTPRKKDFTRRRTISPKPLCQRSLQRHEAFRAAFEKMKIDEAAEANKRVPNRRPIRPRTTAGSSVPPRLPSVRTSHTPSRTPRLQRRQWFPEKSPEPQYRPRKVREAATQQRFRQQAGGMPLNLSPGIGVTPRSALSFPPKSPEIQRGEGVEQRTKMRRSKKEKLYGQTQPPAEADADSVVVEDARLRAHHRYRHRQQDKHQFRLKSQQLQYQRMHQYDGTNERMHSLPAEAVESYRSLRSGFPNGNLRARGRGGPGTGLVSQLSEIFDVTPHQPS